MLTKLPPTGLRAGAQPSPPAHGGNGGQRTGGTLVTPTQVVVLRPPAVSGYPQARSGATGRG
ncbi:MAG TPA: hypothetical protein VK823_31010 [Streptosporangiaceae bacterium]|nr:hypothetical protein [Streptosporangiaceae bacterium]